MSSSGLLLLELFVGRLDESKVMTRKSAFASKLRNLLSLAPYQRRPFLLTKEKAGDGN